MKLIATGTILSSIVSAQSFGLQNINIRLPFAPARGGGGASAIAETPLSSWQDLKDKLPAPLSPDERAREPVLTFYRDTNGWCPFCERVWVCIRAKNLPYQERLIPLFDKPEWYKEMVPTTQVPAVLFHSNSNSNSETSNSNTTRALVWESLDIMKALDDAFPDTTRLVLDTKEYKAASEQNARLNTAGFGYAYATRNRGNGTLPLTEAELQQKNMAFVQALDELENALVASGGPFRLGKEFSGIDAEMIPSLERWRYQLPITKEPGFDILEGRPALAAWFQAMDAFAPYSERVAGDEYSWVATAAMFARYFGGGDDDVETQATIARSEAVAKGLVGGFQVQFDTDAGDGACEARFALEAARKIVSNHEAIVKDCTNQDPKSQMNVDRSKSQENANLVMQYVVELLLRGGEAIECARTSPIPSPLMDMKKKQRVDAALAAKTVASRLCVPRDMSAPAAKVLRAVLMIVADRLVN